MKANANRQEYGEQDDAPTHAIVLKGCVPHIGDRQGKFQPWLECIVETPDILGAPHVETESPSYSNDPLWL